MYLFILFATFRTAAGVARDLATVVTEVVAVTTDAGRDPVTGRVVIVGAVPVPTSEATDDVEIHASYDQRIAVFVMTIFEI